MDHEELREILNIKDRKDRELVKKSRGRPRKLLLTIMKLKREKEEIREQVKEEIMEQMETTMTECGELGGEARVAINGAEREIIVTFKEEKLLINQVKTPYDIMLHKLPKPLWMKIPVKIRIHLNMEMQLKGISIIKPNNGYIKLFHASEDGTCYGTLNEHYLEKITNKEQVEKILQEYRDMMQTITVNKGFTVGNHLIGVKRITNNLYQRKGQTIRDEDIDTARKGNPYLITKEEEWETEKNNKKTTFTHIMEKPIEIKQGN